MRIRVLTFLLFVCLAPAVFAQNKKIAVLDISETASNFSVEFSEKLIKHPHLNLLDADLARAPARGAGAENLLNLSLDEATNLGTAIDCDFFFVIKSETWRRSSFQKDLYFESFAIVFLVSARSGRLIAWEDRHFTADTTEAAEKLRRADLADLTARFAARIESAADSERRERAEIKPNAVTIEDLPAEESAENFRIPLPFKRLRPEYTAAAGRLNIEATVDAEAELNERGEVTKVEIVRWAGFDLDEATIATVKKMQFRPALRDGKAVPIRVLLRYNFRDLQKETGADEK